MMGIVHHLATTGSTNADLLALARNGEPDGTWVRADEQTAGRGRLGRAWVSPPGNLYASRLVRLRPGDPPPATLALVAGLAVDQAASGYVLPARLRLKWPNDLLLDGGKLAGMLLEAGGGALVIGIGVNLAHAPGDLGRSVAWLGSATGHAIDSGEFLNRIEAALAPMIAHWRSEGLGGIRRAWVERAHAVGTPLQVRAGEETIDGRFAGLDADGALLLDTAGGTRIIHAGDVFTG